LKQEIQTKRRQLEEAYPYQLKADIPQRLTDGRINYLLDEMASDDFVADTNRISASEWGKTVMKNELFFNPTPLRGSWFVVHRHRHRFQQNREWPPNSSPMAVAAQ
jgi:hypothetical protein